VAPQTTGKTEKLRKYRKSWETEIWAKGVYLFINKNKDESLDYDYNVF